MSGGHLIPDDLVEVAVDYANQPSAFAWMPRPKRPPLSRRQKFRIWRMTMRRRVHDFLFPDFVEREDER